VQWGLEIYSMMCCSVLKSAQPQVWCALNIHVECISRTTARILANKHSKVSVFLHSFDRTYCINYTIFLHARLSSLLKFLPNLLNLDRVWWTVPWHMRCMHCQKGIFGGSNLIPYSTYSVQGVPRILIFLSRNSDSVDLCCLDRSIHILGLPAWNMSSKGSDWSH